MNDQEWNTFRLKYLVDNNIYLPDSARAEFENGGTVESKPDPVEETFEGFRPLEHENGTVKPEVLPAVEPEKPLSAAERMMLQMRKKNVS